MYGFNSTRRLNILMHSMASLTSSTSLFVLLIVHTLLLSCVAAKDYSQEKENAYWHKVADDELRKTLSNTNTLGRAKNIILFLGDGMGPTSVTAGRILAGQKKGFYGEDYRLSFDHFPHTGLAVTYNVNTQVTDSAASATAYTSGVKANHGTLGVNGKAIRGDCNSTKGNDVDTILRWFLDEGRAGGVVTTTTVTHATPGATYSHSAERDWQSDTNMPEQARKDGCKDIAAQLIDDNQDINVIMGGGMTFFKPLNFTHVRPDQTPWLVNLTKGRLDLRDLTQIWQDKMKSKNLKHRFVSTKEELDTVDPKETDYLFGLFTEYHMAYEIERNSTLEPSLAEMTEKAISVLKNNPKGFFLMVEGGRIDHGHHDSLPSKALHDVIAFDEAVTKALSITDEKDTLILVTADHSHTMSIAGYASRGHPILGISDTEGKTTDNMPYTTIIYGNGLGYKAPRQNLTGVDTTDKDYVSQAAVPVDYETHGGEDVAMYAKGPQSHLYAGVHENNYIPMLMAYASCVGPYKDNCAPAIPGNSSDRLQVSLISTFIMGFLITKLWRH